MSAGHDAAAALEQALRESQRRLSTIVAGAPLVLWAVDRDLKFTFCEGRGLEVFGLRGEDLVGRDAAAMYAERPEIVANAKRALAGEQVNELVDYFGRVWDVTYAPLWEDGRIAGVIGVNTDVTDRRRTEAALAASELRYRTLVEKAPDGIVAIDADGLVLGANPAAERLFGRDADELRGQPLLSLVVEPPEGDLDEPVPLVVRTPDGLERPVELRMIRHEGGDGPAMTAIVRDLTERRRQELRLRDLADHDPLTGLINRRRFEEELRRMIARCERHGRRAAVVLLDLDELKAVNDTLGHSAGDAMIRRAAEALRGRVRTEDALARLGGDEFAVLLEDAGAEEGRRVAEDLLAALREWPRTSGAHGGAMTASAGVTTIAGTGSDPDGVLARVDAAMYEAKELGRDRVVAVGPDAAPARARRAWAGRIRTALEDGGLVLHAQPVLDLATDEIALHEVLVRLAEPGGRLLPPRSFLAQAERAGLAVDLDRAVVRAAVAAVAAGGGEARISVNVSPPSVADPDFPAWVAAELAAARVEPDRVVLEIAEAVAVADAERAGRFGASAHGWGMAIALDDFGAGYGSFAVLKHLPIDYVKVGREYLAGVRTTRADRVLVRGLVQVARGIGMRTIAQQVEDPATLEAVRELGVDLAQGHEIARAGPIAEVIAPS